MSCIRVAKLVVLVSFLSLLSAPVSAQTQRFFVGAGVIADNDNTNSALRPGTAASWTLVAGVEGRRFGIRGVFEAPHETSIADDGFFGRPPSTSPVEERLTRTNRTMTFGVLGDVHGQVTPSLRLAGTFGLLTVTHGTEAVLVRTEVRPDGTRVALPDLRERNDFNWYGAAFGMEAAVSLGPRLEIVPEVRFLYFGPYESHPYIIRSGVGARWRF